MSADVWNEDEFFSRLDEVGSNSEAVNKIFESENLAEVLRAIVNRRKIEIVRKLTEDPKKFVTVVDLDLWTEIINLAAEKEFFEIYRELKEIEYEFKNVIEDIALEKAIDSEQYRMFAYLRANGFNTDKENELQDKIRNLSDKKKEQIRIEILNFTIKNPDQLNSSPILSKCELYAASNFDDIRLMIEDLSKIEEIRSVLEILALSNVRIIFDLKNESILSMDPSTDENSFGLSYFKEGILYIGRNGSKNQRYGTFALQATSFALYLIYENQGLPYKDNDEEKKMGWLQVFSEIQNIYYNDPKGVNDSIRWTFELYRPGYEQISMLITRVNELLASYYDDSQKREEMREKYAPLFKFYRDFVLPDLSSNAYKMIKLNNDLELFQAIDNSKFEIEDTQNYSLLRLEEKIEDKNLIATKNFLLLSNIPQLTLSKLLRDIFHHSFNKLHVKTKNIFINFKSLQSKYLVRVCEDALKLPDIERIIIYFESDDVPQKYCLEFLRGLKKEIKIFIVASERCENIIRFTNEIFVVRDFGCFIEGGELKVKEKTEDLRQSYDDKSEILQVNVNHSWNDLTQKSQQKFSKMKAKFHDEDIPSDSLEQKLLAETFKTLTTQNEHQVLTSKSEKIKHYVDRKILKKITRKNNKSNYKSMSLENFIKEAENDKIVLISDEAGNGKTTLLHKIHEILTEQHSDYWISFVRLREHKNLLLDERKISKTFVEIMTEEILALNDLEKKIFRQKYREDKVIIFFDGFDEISPSCKQNALKLFELHQENNKSQIWITTRPHLEVDLETSLNVWESQGESSVMGHKIEPLDEDEQVEFLCKYWENHGANSDIRLHCAKLLSKKFSQLVPRIPSLIGIILQLQMVGDYFKYELSWNFEERLKKFKFSDVYEFMVKGSVKFKEKNSIFDTFKINFSKYEALALRTFLGDGHHLFGKSVLISFECADELEELARDGIIRYDEEQKVFFNHLTVGEFFVSKFFEWQIINYKVGWEYEKDFFKSLMEVLTRNCSIIRMFLNDLLEGQWRNLNIQEKSESVKLFAEAFLKYFNEHKNFETFNVPATH